MDKPQDYSPLRRYGDCKPSLRKTDHDGWVLLDGRTILRSRYPKFFQALEVTADSMKLPASKDAMLIGAGGRVKLGAVGGSNSLTLTAEQLPEHSHNYKDTQTAMTAGKAGLVTGVLPIMTGATPSDNGRTTDKAGVGKPITIEPVALAMNFFVYVGT